MCVKHLSATQRPKTTQEKRAYLEYAKGLGQKRRYLLLLARWQRVVVAIGRLVVSTVIGLGGHLREKLGLGGGHCRHRTIIISVLDYPLNELYTFCGTNLRSLRQTWAVTGEGLREVIIIFKGFNFNVSQCWIDKVRLAFSTSRLNLPIAHAGRNICARFFLYC